MSGGVWLGERVARLTVENTLHPCSLEFNADKKHYDHIIFTGKKCSSWTPWGQALCHDLVSV